MQSGRPYELWTQGKTLLIPPHEPHGIMAALLPELKWFLS